MNTSTIKKRKPYKTDCVVIGAGIFGLYAAWLLTKKGQDVIILEKGLRPFARASAINQAREHNGYHYPRSYETAKKVADYYQQFNCEFSFAINNSYKHIYAISKKYSKTSAKEFALSCSKVNIPLQEIDSDSYFQKGSVEAAFLVQEFSFDFTKIRNFLLNKICHGTRIIYDAHIDHVEKGGTDYLVLLNNGCVFSTPLVINATYSGINDVIDKFGHEPFILKYELCEVAFCTVPETLKDIGITVMDGDFFSFIPFGSDGIHSLTSVGHTPHDVSYDVVPVFKNAAGHEVCDMHGIRYCIVCAQRLQSAWSEMYSLGKRYMLPMFDLKYLNSKFEIKPILIESEEDDSRPTIIKEHTTNPTFVSVFSGKISTIYDLKKIIQ